MINIQALPCCDFAPAIAGAETRTSVVCRLPDVPAIYFICDGGSEVFYIGESDRLRMRFFQHHKWGYFQKEPSMKLYWMNAAAISPDLRFEMERQLIRVFRPRLNKRGVLNSREDFSVTSELLDGLQMLGVNLATGVER